MPAKDAAARRRYQREWKRRQRLAAKGFETARHPSAELLEREAALHERNMLLLRERWTACIWRMFTETPCTQEPRWLDGQALYCDEHRSPRAVPWSGWEDA